MIFKAVFENLKKLYRYLLNKRSELENLNVNDILLAKLVLDIHRKKITNTFQKVPLYSIEPIHPINRENSLAATLKRAEAVRSMRDEIILSKCVDREVLGTYLPSISWIKVIDCQNGNFVSFEGNGRLEALKKVFNKGDGITVEVEVYTIKNVVKIQRRIDRVRRHNGVGKGE
jgi:hypothetical protein